MAQPLQISGAEFLLLAGDRDEVMAPPDTRFIFFSAGAAVPTGGPAQKRGYNEAELDVLEERRLRLRGGGFAEVVFRRARNSPYQVHNRADTWSYDDGIFRLSSRATVEMRGSETRAVHIPVEAVVREIDVGADLVTEIRSFDQFSRLAEYRGVFDFGVKYDSVYRVKGLGAFACTGVMAPERLPRPDSPFWVHMRMRHLGLPMDGWNWDNALHVMLYMTILRLFSSIGEKRTEIARFISGAANSDTVVMALIFWTSTLYPLPTDFERYFERVSPDEGRVAQLLTLISVPSTSPFEYAYTLLLRWVDPVVGRDVRQLRPHSYICWWGTVDEIQEQQLFPSTQGPRVTDDWPGTIIDFVRMDFSLAFHRDTPFTIIDGVLHATIAVDYESDAKRHLRIGPVLPPQLPAHARLVPVTHPHSLAESFMLRQYHGVNFHVDYDFASLLSPLGHLGNDSNVIKFLNEGLDKALVHYWFPDDSPPSESEEP